MHGRDRGDRGEDPTRFGPASYAATVRDQGEVVRTDSTCRRCCVGNKVNNETIERPLPQSAELEKAVLGAILVGHKQRAELLNTLQSDDFFDRPNGTIFAAMLALHGNGVEPDLLGIHDMLIRNGQTEAAGGPAYLSAITRRRAPCRRHDARRPPAEVNESLPEGDSPGGVPEGTCLRAI